jgi:hypothetical protein
VVFWGMTLCSLELWVVTNVSEERVAYIFHLISTLMMEAGWM